MATVADHIIAQLRAAGVRALFGVPGGGSNLDLIEAAGTAGLPFILTSTETGGAIAAMAQAEVTGHAGACLTTLGPGAASVVNGVACAFLDRAAMIVLTWIRTVSATRRAYPPASVDATGIPLRRACSNISRSRFCKPSMVSASPPSWSSRYGSAPPM